MSGRIRVLVADDSLTVRKRLVEVLSADPAIEVIGEAADGREAVALCARLRPDVVTLDIVMPGLSGVAATEEIMAYHPTPILVVSSAEHRGELYDTYAALAAGAVDVLEKPINADADWDRRLLQSVKLVSRIKVITHPRAKLTRSRAAAPIAPHAATASSGRLRLVAIGASTGGPGALREVLSQLPASFPLPVLIVLHIGEPFGAMIAEWLSSVSALSVRTAKDGEALPAVGQGGVILAPPDYHMVLAGGRLHLSQAPERHSCRPSVDVLFESVAREHGPEAVGCLLTGMGRDGAAGLLAMRRAGAHTIAQDEATSVVFGMPREAIQLAAASAVLPIGEIAGALAALAAGRDPWRTT